MPPPLYIEDAQAEQEPRVEELRRFFILKRL
jgi:hypothetical protein